MEKYTLADFEQFTKNEDGFIVCPSGDYTEIKSFPECCSFGEWCHFGERCSFGRGCSFGECCSFGEKCSFGERCSFGKCCSFPEHCSFGEWCRFGKCCSFGEKCSFGERCRFGKWCICEQNHEFVSLFQVGYIGSRDDTTQFWLLTDKNILVRCGCFCGNIKEFEQKVVQTHGDNHYAKEYLAAAALAKLHFDYKEQNNARDFV